MSTSNRPMSDAEDRPDAFEPGSSFADEPAQAANAAEALPSWLQSFADTVSDDEPQPFLTPGQSEQPRAAVGQSPVAAAPDANLPGWLDEQAQAPLPGTPGSTLEAGDGLGFLTDDDLPEWLRSLDPGTVATSVAPRAAMGVPATRATVMIPDVSRVWVTPHEAAPAPLSAPLFASIASTLDERPDVSASEEPLNSASSPAMPVEEPIIAQTAPATVVRPSNGRWSRKVIWLVVMFIILAVVMLWILMQLQG